VSNLKYSLTWLLPLVRVSETVLVNKISLLLEKCFEILIRNLNNQLIFQIAEDSNMALDGIRGGENYYNRESRTTDMNLS
jgi:hypothetical protein